MSPLPTTIELYLVRHAVAAERGPEYPDDARRPLTPDGVRRFRESVRGLRTLGVTLDLVLTSPLVRARETADILRAGLRPAPRLIVSDALAPGTRPADAIAAVLARAGSGRGAARVAVVGHEPDLGELAARWLGAKAAIPFKKGAVLRFDVDRALPAGPGTLRWFLPPRALRGLAR